MTRIMMLLIMMLLIMIMIMFQGCSSGKETGWVLTIREMPENEPLFSVDLEPEDTLRFHWIHSVEHIEWTETFRLGDEGMLYLIESRFAGFGAGIPHDHQDGFRVEEGMMIFEPKDHEIPYYDWIHSHTALPKMTMNGELLLKGEDLPHHQSLRMTIEER